MASLYNREKNKATQKAIALLEARLKAQCDREDELIARAQQEDLEKWQARCKSDAETRQANMVACKKGWAAAVKEHIADHAHQVEEDRQDLKRRVAKDEKAHREDAEKAAARRAKGMEMAQLYRDGMVSL